MKRLLALMTALIFALALTGCGQKNTLMEGASPDTSALALYVYDGQTTTRGFMFDSDTEKALLKSLAAVPAKPATDWSPELITLPVYGLEIGAWDDPTVRAAWSNGYWIAQDGTAYHFDYDFESLAADDSWESKDTWSTHSAIILPCARHLSQSANGWVKAMLSPATEITQRGISAQLVDQDGDTWTVALTNNSEEESWYGVSYYLDVLLDGVWYSIPTVPGDWAFIEVAMILPAGKTQNETYNLSMYGDLPAGQYRFVASDCAAFEFTIAE